MSLVRSVRVLMLIVVFVASMWLSPQIDAHVQDEPQATAPLWAEKENRWFSISIAGAHAGWLHHLRSSDGEHIRTVQQMEINLNRGGATMSVGSQATFIETQDGKPIEITATQLMGESGIERQITFTTEGVVVDTKQGDRTHRAMQPLPEGSWLMPAATERFVDARLAANAEVIEYRTADVEMGFRIVDVEMKRVGQETVEFDGREIPVAVYESKIAGMPMVSRELYDQKGELVRSVTTLPIGDMVTARATQAKAQADADQIPEIMVQTFVRPDRPIANSLSATSARYRLRALSDPLPELPSAGAQQIEPSSNDKQVDIVVDIASRHAADNEDRSNSEFIAASVTADSEDPAVQRLAQSAIISAGEDPFDRAEAMRRFVHEFVSRKSLSMAFATASEVARSRAGDCSEHAVLLAAMLRSQGIPSRAAAGLIYADSFVGQDDIFGWHMWTQALIDGQWVDFDATLPRRFTAGHILVGTSSLADGSMAEDLVAMLGLMGNISIEIVSVGYAPEPPR